MTEFLILEKDAEIYARRLRQEFPGAVFHAATTEGEALELAANAEAIVALAHDVSAVLVSRTAKLRWIAALTTGTDHLDTLGLSPEIVVTSGRGIHGPQMAELAFFYMIALSRNARAMMDNQRRHAWERWPQRLLLGKTAVLVGVGAISEELAQRCRAFGMSVVGVSSARTTARGFDRIVPRESLVAVAAEADFLIVLVPYSRETHHMIDGTVLSAMKPAAVFINIARGKVVDEAALIRHLQERRIAGAGLDVYEEEPPAPGQPALGHGPRDHDAARSAA